MKLWAALSNAGAGWRMIATGEAGWQDRFALTAPGLVTALIVFMLATFLGVAIASFTVGLPSLFGIAAAMLALALPLVSLILVLHGTRMALGSTGPVRNMMVPAVYALAVFVLVEGVLAMVAGPLVMLAWLGLAWLLYRLARTASGWNVAISGGFAVLTVVLLVAMRLGLYMLSSTGIPT